MIRSLNKVGLDGIYLNIIKAMCEKPTANIILNCEKLRTFPLRSGKTAIFEDDLGTIP